MYPHAGNSHSRSEVTVPGHDSQTEACRSVLQFHLVSNDGGKTGFGAIDIHQIAFLQGSEEVIG